MAGSAVSPAHSTLWGLGRVIALEHPQVWGGLIDLEPNALPSLQAAQAAAEIRAAGSRLSSEDQIAYRGGRRYLARLVRAGHSLLSTHPPLPRELVGGSALINEASYLITGGLGGLGLLLARWLAEQGAKYIVLIGRHGLPPREEWDSLVEQSNRTEDSQSDLARQRRIGQQVSAIRAIEAMGTSIEVVAADVNDPAAMERLIASFGANGIPPLKGIFHAAAALGSAALADLRPDQIRAVLAPKVAGTWNLHLLTRRLPLDFFVLFSSTTALWGSSQLGHYAAANTFLDAFAHYRHSLGLPALSVNWGTWEVMRVASQSEQQRVAQFGLAQMPAQTALALLARLIEVKETNFAQIAVAAVDWRALKSAYEARRARPFLSLVQPLPTSHSPLPTSHSGDLYRSPLPSAPRPVLPPLVELTQSAAGSARRDLVIEHVRQKAAKVINAPDPHALDIHQGLFEMGLDSLMSVELKSSLEASVGAALPSTLTFNYPTIAELARYLDESILPKPQETKEAAATEQTAGRSAQEVSATAQGEESHTSGETTPPSQASDLDDLSEDDLAALLAAKLSNVNRR